MNTGWQCFKRGFGGGGVMLDVRVEIAFGGLGDAFWGVESSLGGERESTFW